MKAKAVPLPEMPKPKPKTGTGWLAVFAQPDQEPDPDSNDGIFSENTYYDHKPTGEELKEELKNADEGWELIALLEIKL